MSAVGERYAAALRALRSAWETDRFIVIGAAAIELHVGLRWRQTFDLDLSVAAGLDAYGGDLESLGWRRERSAPQRWIAPDGAIVDVVPAAPSLVRQGGFNWPDSGAHMSLVGFRLAFADAVPREVAPAVEVRVASLRSLIPLKMAAYLERPWERDSDLADLSHILSGFLGPDAAERWSEDVLDLGLDFEDVGPFLIGRQLGDLVDEAERSLVLSFLDRVEDPADRLSTLHRMARRAPSGWKEADQMGARLLAFRSGFAPPS